MPDVLLITQDFGFADSIGGLLRFEGHDTRQASDGDGALAELQHRSPDVVVLDGTGANSTCLTTCRLVREIDSGLPILFLTNGDPSRRRGARDAGATECLTTPFPNDELLSRLATLTSRCQHNFESRVHRDPCSFTTPRGLSHHISVRSLPGHLGRVQPDVLTERVPRFAVPAPTKVTPALGRQLIRPAGTLHT